MKTDSTADPIALVPGRSDWEVANELRTEIEEAMRPACDALTKAKRLGFEVNFGCGPDYSGRVVLTALKISKEFRRE